MPEITPELHALAIRAIAFAIGELLVYLLIGLPMTRHAKGPLDAKCTPSGHYRDECADCGTIIVASTPDDVLGAMCACTGRRIVRHLVELVCSHCARYVVTVTLAQPRAPVLVPGSLRCDACGGQPIPGDYTDQITYSPMPRVVARRGRPPKWLQELRRSA